MSSVRNFLVSPTGRRVHLAKMLTWRVIATATTIVVSYLVTGDLLVGATIGGIEATSKMALYYGHERAWARLVAPTIIHDELELAGAGVLVQADTADSEAAGTKR